MRVILDTCVIVDVLQARKPFCEDAQKLPCYFSGNIKNVSDKEFETLLGHPIPDGHWSGTLQMNDAICQLYYARSLKARIVYKILTSMLEKSISSTTDRPTTKRLFPNARTKSISSTAFW